MGAPGRPGTSRPFYLSQSRPATYLLNLRKRKFRSPERTAGNQLAGGGGWGGSSLKITLPSLSNRHPRGQANYDHCGPRGEAPPPQAAAGAWQTQASPRLSPPLQEEVRVRIQGVTGAQTRPTHKAFSTGPAHSMSSLLGSSAITAG